MNCSPSYTYRPTFTPSGVKCSAPGYEEHRSRLTESEMFFRSKDQGPETNYLQLEIDASNLYVYFYGTLVETFPATLGPGGIALLRTQVATSDYIEMPTLGYDIYDTRITEDDTLIGVTSFPLTYMKGGSGPPTDASTLAGIRTGPERSLVILRTSEDDTGRPTTPPWYKRVLQWNGSEWITHSNLAQGQCPQEGTS